MVNGSPYPKIATAKRVSAFASFLFAMMLQLSVCGAAVITVSVSLKAQNGSGESGTATLTQIGSDVKVVLAMKGGPATAQPAHIHSGTCANLGGPAYALSNIVGGNSTTILKGLTVGKLLTGTYAINVHESTANMGRSVACAKLPTAKVTP